MSSMAITLFAIVAPLSAGCIIASIRMSK